MKWVTRPGVRLDRAACIWLIRRHIDPAAEILYHDPGDMVQAFADGALPFHDTAAEDMELAERTSFEMLVIEYGLEYKDPAIGRMARIVRGAELNSPDAPAESAGLSAIAKGSKALTNSDEEMVERMLPLFDALYTYCSRLLAGHPSWPNTAAESTATAAGRI